MCALWRPWWCQSHGCDPDGGAAWSHKTILQSGTWAGPYHSVSSVGSCMHISEEDIQSLLHESRHSFLNSIQTWQQNSLDALLLGLLQFSISLQHGSDGLLLLLRQETQINHGGCCFLSLSVGSLLVVQHDTVLCEAPKRSSCVVSVVYISWVMCALSTANDHIEAVVTRQAFPSFPPLELCCLT